MVYIGAICLLFVVIVTLQSILLPPKTYSDGGIEYTHYNNYVIFKQSFFHLIENKDLYQLYPQEHWDLYKYSPAFSLFMGLLAWMPDFFGLLLWNLLNVFVLFFALWKLPFENNRKIIFTFLFLIIQLITSIQNSQSNGLIAGLMIFAYIHLERKKIALAALCIVATVFIKLFGMVAVLLFLCYPGKLRAFLYTAGWTALFVMLPFMVISLAQMEFLYKSWLFLLKNDDPNADGWIHIWFGEKARPVALLAGGGLLCLPFIHYKQFHEKKIRLFFLSSILIWVVIFNHKAESPTYIIAVCGIAIWYFAQKFKPENFILILLAFIFMVLPSADFFPRKGRENVIIPYALKAVSCVLVWLKITWDLIFYKSDNQIPNRLTEIM
jgi:hypothetical protein